MSVTGGARILVGKRRVYEIVVGTAKYLMFRAFAQNHALPTKIPSGTSSASPAPWQRRTRSGSPPNGQTTPPIWSSTYWPYSPSLGRWPSRDPIGEKASPNLYVFVGNRSTMAYDALGMESWPPVVPPSIPYSPPSPSEERETINLRHTNGAPLDVETPATLHLSKLAWEGAFFGRTHSSTTAMELT